MLAPILKNVNSSQMKGQILPQERYLSFLRHIKTPQPDQSPP